LLTAAFSDREGGKGGRRGQAGLVIAAMGEDHHVRMLRWPDFPAGAPKERWEELGPLQELLAPAGESRPAAGRQTATRGARKQKRVSRKKVSRRSAARPKRKKR
jgi:hypothetical protein